VYALTGLHNFIHRNNNGLTAEEDLEIITEDTEGSVNPLPDARERRNGAAWRMREDIAEALWRDYCVIRGIAN